MASRRVQIAVLGVLVLIALAVRVVPAQGDVFGQTSSSWDGVGGSVSFRGTDAWLHMRSAEEWLRSFPTRPTWDRLLLHPVGGAPPNGPLLDFTLASATWVAAFGAPNSTMLEIIGAWFPAILGSLVVVPVFLLGDRIAGPPAGLFAGLLVATMPSSFLMRSALGAVDHHVAEVFFSTCLLLALERIVTAISAAGHHRSLWFWTTIASAALACYLLTWKSGSPIVLFVLVWSLSAVAWLSRSRRQTFLWALSAAHASTLVLVLPWLGDPGVPRLHGWLLTTAILISAGAAWWTGMSARNRWLWTPVAFVVVGTTLALAVRPLDDFLLLLERLRPTPWAAVVSEMRPWLIGQTLANGLWQEFGAAGFLAVGCWLAWSAGWLRSRDPRRTLLLSWALFLFLICLQQRRFLYYLAVVVALFAGFALAWLLRRLGETHVARYRRGVLVDLAVSALALVIVLPTLPAAFARANSLSPPSEEWRIRMRDLGQHVGSSDMLLSPSPEVAGAGVLSWWDRGHWISALARLAPVANPLGQGAARAASFLLAEDEGTAVRIAESVGAEFVVVDSRMPMRPGPGELAFGDFASMPVWLDERPERYFERFEVRDASGQWTPIYGFYPGYFRSMVVRLQTFGGEATERGGTTWWVHYRVARRADGTAVKRIVRLAPWDDRQSQQLAAGNQLTDRGVALVSLDPTRSCVPLQRLERFREIARGGRSGVRLFEILDSGEEADPTVPASTP